MRRVVKLWIVTVFPCLLGIGFAALARPHAVQHDSCQNQEDKLEAQGILRGIAWGVTACQKARYRALNQKLNAKYKRLLAVLNSDERQRTIILQRAWVKEKYKNCHEDPGEEFDIQMGLECLSDETRARVRWINERISKHR